MPDTVALFVMVLTLGVLAFLVARVADRRHEAHRLTLMVLDQNPFGRGVPGDVYVCRPVQEAGTGKWGARIVIPRSVYDGYSVLLKTLHLLQEEPLGLEREAIPVEEVACDQEGVGVLSNGQVGGEAERVPRRLPKSALDRR